MSKLKRKYERYLRSGHWKQLRKQAFERDNWTCVICKKPNRRLQGHHRRYRKNLYDCTVNDIESHCEPCHNEFHRMKAEQRRINRRPRLGISRHAYLIAVFNAEPTYEPHNPNPDPAPAIH